MGWFGDPMNSGAGNRTREGKVEKGQSARDIVGYRTSSRPRHEEKREREHMRAQARKDRKAAERAANGSDCLPIAVAMVGGLLAILSGLVYGVAKVIG